jgi:hypothetical protein
MKAATVATLRVAQLGRRKILNSRKTMESLVAQVSGAFRDRN